MNEKKWSSIAVSIDDKVKFQELCRKEAVTENRAINGTEFFNMLLKLWEDKKVKP